ncbi:MAG TPA: polysaccharide deacetylase family protein [Steroidobacteraceae bacterium]|nr:polysaccharide deacetylase family protein [Steroidobacteraceae bacterium]
MSSDEGGATSERAPVGVRRIALKVDVDTLRGTLEGVPALASLLERLKLPATFYFSVGPDHTGRALRRIFRRGFLGKVRRTSVASHYGMRTLLYGTLLPGPHIGARAGAAMRAVRDAGFEVGVHCYDHIRWQDGVAAADAAWTRRELTRAIEAFAAVFGEPPRSHAAAGWQLNPNALALEEELGFAYASDTRGPAPFLPSMDGVDGACMQLPTTLPTFDELIGVEGRDPAGAAAEVLRLSREAPRPSREASRGAHVFTLHAELEGGKLLPQFEWLLKRWQEEGFGILAMRDLASCLDARALPRHEVRMAAIEGRSGVLAVQGRRIDSGRPA